MSSNVSVLKKKGPFLTKKSVVRGSFLFWRTIIRPPFMLEWRDRDTFLYLYYWPTFNSMLIYVSLHIMTLLLAEYITKFGGHRNQNNPTYFYNSTYGSLTIVLVK